MRFSLLIGDAIISLYHRGQSITRVAADIVQ